MVRSFLLLGSLALVACPTPVDPPIPYAEPAALSFSSPNAGAVENPVQLRVEAPDEVAQVTYIADGWFTMGRSTDAAAGFPFGMDFAVLGPHTLVARGFDAAGDFVADAELAIDVLPDPMQLNELGAWLHPELLEHPDFDHASYSERLAGIGVKRVYLAAGTGEPDCDAVPDLCDHDVSDRWRALGVEPWVWMHAEGGVAGLAQGETIRSAVTAGYQGIVVDIAATYANDVDGVQDLLSGMLWVRSQCDTTGLHLGGNFPIYVTSSTHPDSMGIPLSAMDAAVDGYLPRTDMAGWTSDPADAAVDLLCSWEDAGKPVHPVVDVVSGSSLSALDPFVGAGGREASLYRVPLPDASEASWDDWAALDWWGGSFSPPDCGGAR